MTLIPFNSHGIWFSAKKIGKDWRVIVHNGGGLGTDTLFGNAAHTEEMAETIADQQNQLIYMDGIIEKGDDK